MTPNSFQESYLPPKSCFKGTGRGREKKEREEGNREKGKGKRRGGKEKGERGSRGRERVSTVILLPRSPLESA